MVPLSGETQLKTALLLAAAAFAGSMLLSGMMRRYALARSLLDVPNERSSHSVPTPLGGGFAIVFVFLAGLTALWILGLTPSRVFLALAGGGTLVAAAGWWDDRWGLPRTARLAAHATAAVWALVWLGGMPSLTVGEEAVRLGAGGSILAALAIIWSVNLYNFMDGIDGLAAGEALLAGLAAALLLGLRDSSLAFLPLLLSAAAGGFLLWNRSPARLFMGDVGSGFLGFVFAGLAVASENTGRLPALVWVVLLGAFFADATITLVRRVVRRERWYAAHRSHAYQRAVQAGWSHGRVTAFVLALDLVLALLAWVGSARRELLLPAVGLAAALLTVTYLFVERRWPAPPPEVRRSNSRPTSGPELAGRRERD
jgi:Fuc2NAc and GlcNAc transferase